MGLFDVFKKKPKPYNDPSINLIYELLFCDDVDLYQDHNKQSNIYPWNVLFSENATIADLEELLTNNNTESRVKLLTYNKLRAMGQVIDQKILFGVIVELGLDGGLDVLASFSDGTARYINQSGKIIVWETADQLSLNLINKLFENSYNIITQIGPWDEPRKPNPEKGMVRITFLVSDGLYFGEGPINILFSDPMAAPALSSAAQLMKYLVEKAS